MSQPYAILRTEKVKTMADVGSRAAHNMRSSETAAPHADSSKRAKNRVLIGPKTAAGLVDLVREKLDQVPTFRKDAIRAVELVLTASPEFFKTAKPADLGAWRDASLAWLRKTWGEDNVASAVLHLDEATPHIQAIVVPVHDGKLRAAHWLDGPAKMGKLQDGYAKAVAQLGLKRGEKRTAPVEHQPVGAFYAAAQRAQRRKPGPRVRLPARGPLGGVSTQDWAKLERDLADQNRHVDDLEAVRAGQLDRRQLELAQLKLLQLDKKIDETTAKLAELTKNVERASGLLDQQRNDFNARYVAIEKLDTAIAEKTAHLAELEAHIEAAQEMLKPAKAERPRGG
jgi:hypothetical protein